MTTSIDVTRDAEGLRIAAIELLEEGFARLRVAPSFEGGAEESQDHAFASLPPRTLADGYYVQAEYLFSLDEWLQAGVQLGNLTMCEVDGVMAIRRARLHFEHEHPACSGCGALQDGRFALACNSCGTEFKRAS